MASKRRILDQKFYSAKPEIVAKKLLGKYLVRKIGKNILTGRIVEVEAYLANKDQAAHNYVGQTKRNQSLYKDAGHAYVHSMRQYCLIDIVTERKNVPSSVLIRAIEPVHGIEKMKKFRNVSVVEEIGNGPGKVCQALQITKKLDGIDLSNIKSELYLMKIESNVSKKCMGVSKRIGISKSSDLPLRFYIKDNLCVSKK